ncbi:MAG: antibiotic biosynthesis monooxygenase [Rikenellaceae bacterium]|nr:antibiotic biosynthesis monooxygenase [Rikenellaceae bacterium]
MKKRIVIAKIQVKKEKQEEFLALAQPLVESSLAEPGNLIYSLYRETDDPTRFLVYEEYADQEAFEKHDQSAHFQSFAQNVGPLLAKELDIQTF